jgi:hypothetical protein
VASAAVEEAAVAIVAAAAADTVAVEAAEIVIRSWSAAKAIHFGGGAQART